MSPPGVAPFWAPSWASWLTCCSTVAMSFSSTSLTSKTKATPDWLSGQCAVHPAHAPGGRSVHVPTGTGPCMHGPADRRMRRSELPQLDRGDPDRLDRFVAAVGLHALQGVDDVHPALHLAEDGVFAVQPRARLGGDDEELRAVCVGARIGHRQRATDELVRVDLVLERVARA